MDRDEALKLFGLKGTESLEEVNSTFLSLYESGRNLQDAVAEEKVKKKWEEMLFKMEVASGTSAWPGHFWTA